MAVRAEPDLREAPVSRLVALAIERRGAAQERGGGLQRDTARVIGDSLSYDAVLVELCKRLGVEQELTGSAGPPAARRVAEGRLAARLPALASLVDRPGSSRRGAS